MKATSVFLVILLLFATAFALQNYAFSSTKTVKTEENTDQKNQTLIPESSKTTYYVYWFLKEENYDVGKSFYVEKNEPYNVNVTIPVDNLKSVTFKLDWKDDVTTPLFGFGKDRLTLLIISPDETELFDKQSIGKGSLKYTLDDINKKPGLNHFFGDSISDAENMVSKYYNSKWKDEVFKISIKVKIGEIRFIKRLLDKGNDFSLQISYQYYYPEIIDYKDEPSDTYVLMGPSEKINSNNVSFFWSGFDDFTSTDDLEYSYKLVDCHDWSDWTKSTSVDYNNLDEGEYTFFVKSRDHRKNIDPTPVKISFIVEIIDTVAPDTSITSGPSDRINYDDVVFKWTGSDDFTPKNKIQYSYILEGWDTKWSDWTTSTSKKYYNLENKEYTFKVKSKDEKGNIDPSPAEQYFRVYVGEDDKNPPDTNILSGPNGVINCSSVTFTWCGSDDVTPSNRLYYSYKLIGLGNSWSEWDRSTTKTFHNLKNDDYTFQVKSKDESGNVDPTPDQRSFTVYIDPGPNRFASSIVELNFGNSPHPGFMDPLKTLGGPHGLGDTMGSLDVLSLGVGGDITLGFEITIKNGPSKDFTIFENPFFFSNQDKVYAELMYVEVSTDGINFARFPSESDTIESGLINPDDVENLAGVYPVYANIDENDIDPFNPDISGGDSFDLDDLINDPLVQSGIVDLENIHYIRLIDILGDGSCLDSRGQPIYDPIDMDNGADLDAIAIINYKN